jgi:hypothetical protein
VFFKGEVTTTILRFSPLPTLISPLVRRCRTRGLATPSGGRQGARPRSSAAPPRELALAAADRGRGRHLGDLCRGGRPPPAGQTSATARSRGRPGRRALPWGRRQLGRRASPRGTVTVIQASSAVEGCRQPGCGSELRRAGPRPAVRASSAARVPGRSCGRAPPPERGHCRSHR